MKTKNMLPKFPIGTSVNVVQKPGDDFNHDFIGTVIGFRRGYVQVRDQDDDVWECDAAQVSLQQD